MTTEQRRALGGAIPTTEVIRDAVTFPRDRLGEPLDISPERFEAWLARVRRDAAREALIRLRVHLARARGYGLIGPKGLDYYIRREHPEETP